MEHRSSRLALVAVIVTVLLAALALLRNPLNWGVTSSSRFTVAAFRTIRPGDTVAHVVDVLGEPLSVERKLTCSARPCENYIFADEPVAPWVYAHRKAWVYVDLATMTVHHPVLVTEP